MKMSMWKSCLAASASIAALALATQAFAGNNNEVYVTQAYPGTGNSFTATQDGNSNLVGAQHSNFASTVYYFQQGGSGNTANVYQQGDANKIGYNASGNPEAAYYPGVPSGNTTYLGQKGTNNTAALYQVGSGGGVNGSNRLGIFTQKGDGNDATLNQSGDGNQVESLTQNGGSSGGHNVAKVAQIGNNNGGTGSTIPMYIGTLVASHDVAAVNPSPPPATTTYTVSGLGVSGVQLNELANLNQVGSYNLAELGFQGNNNRFNLNQISDESAANTGQANTFLAGANGLAVKSGATSTLNPLVGNDNYVYGYQNGSGNSVALSQYGGSVSNVLFLVSQSGVGGVGTAGSGNSVEWTIKSDASFEAIQLGDDNTVTGGQDGCCSPHTVKTYQTGSGNTIYAHAGNGTSNGLIDIYQEGTSNWFYATQTGPSSTIVGTQIGLMNVADVRQGTGGGGGNTVNILQH